MPKVFISFASADYGSAELLNEILQFHDITTWFFTHDIIAGTDYKAEISKALGEVDYLLILVSNNALTNPGWVIREIAEYVALKKDGKIIPLCLDDAVPDKLYDGLSAWQAIAFDPSPTSGFEKLLAVFDRPFLSKARIRERRKTDRRSGTERRVTPDRRKSPPYIRMRWDFWSSFNRETEVGRFDEYDVSLSMTRVRVEECLKSVIHRYTFRDIESGLNIDGNVALKMALKSTWVLYLEVESPFEGSSRPRTDS